MIDWMQYNVYCSSPIPAATLETTVELSMPSKAIVEPGVAKLRQKVVGKKNQQVVSASPVCVVPVLQPPAKMLFQPSWLDASLAASSHAFMKQRRLRHVSSIAVKQVHNDTGLAGTTLHKISC
eukprot:85126-Pleurochrysis_carterae.AAC.7